MEIIMELIMLVVVALIGFMAGWHLKGIITLYRLSENPEAMIKILEKIKELNEAKTDEELAEVMARNEGTELAIERVGDRLYAYAKETNQFIAQGSDLKDLLETAHKRFPGKVFFGNIPADDPAKELA